jgi:hypothetical protein
MEKETPKEEKTPKQKEEEKPRELQVPVAFIDVTLDDKWVISLSGYLIDKKNVVFIGGCDVPDFFPREIRLDFSDVEDSTFAHAFVTSTWQKTTPGWFKGPPVVVTPQEKDIAFETEEYMDPILFKGRISLSKDAVGIDFSIPLDQFRYITTCAQRRREARTNILFYEKDITK